MVKSIIYTIAAILLCTGFFIFTEIYVNRQFEDFKNAANALYDKVENKTATREDASAVRTLWDDKRSKLHIFVPHNDISYVDYWINEACGLIYVGDYEAALGKCEVLRSIAETLPGAYKVQLENIL